MPSVVLKFDGLGIATVKAVPPTLSPTLVGSSCATLTVTESPGTIQVCWRIGASDGISHAARVPTSTATAAREARRTFNGSMGVLVSALGTPGRWEKAAHFPCPAHDFR